MNWKRGLFRLWLVATCAWVVGAAWVFADNFTATIAREQIPAGVNPYSCIFERRPCERWPVVHEPNLDVRREGFIAVLGPPIAVPIVLFLLYWAGRVSWRVGTWVARGFREAA